MPRVICLVTRISLRMSAKASYIRLDFRVSSSARISHGNQYPRVPLCFLSLLSLLHRSHTRPRASCLLPRASRLAPPLLDNLSTVRVSRFAFIVRLYSPFLRLFFCSSVSSIFLQVSLCLLCFSPTLAEQNRGSLSSPNGRTSGSFFSDTASRRSPSVSDKRDLENGLPRIRQPNSPLRQIGLRIPGCMYTPVSRTQIHPPRERILFLFLSLSLTFSVSRASNRLLSVPATQNLPPTVELARSPAALGPPRRSKHCFRGPLPSGALLSLHLSRYAELDFYAEPMHPLRTCFSYRYQPLPIHSIVFRG